jgi:hypothetical protein
MKIMQRMTLDERAEEIRDVMRRLRIRMDANETMMFARQLEQIEARLFEVKYPEGHAIELVPLNTAIDPGALTYTYRAGDYSGEAKRVVNWATDFPRVDLQGKEVTHKLDNYGASFGYDLQQLRSAKFANFALESQLNAAARRVIMRKLDANLWFGDSQIGVTGLANNALVSLVSVITGTWTSATADQILADAQKLISAAENASKGVEKSNAVILPVSRYTLLAAKFMGVSAPGFTVLDMLKKANPGVAFYQSYQLETANAAGTGPRAIAFTSDSEQLEGLVPIEFEVLPAVDQGGQFEVKVMGRFGGVAIRYPLSVQYMDSI